MLGVGGWNIGVVVGGGARQVQGHRFPSTWSNGGGAGAGSDSVCVCVSAVNECTCVCVQGEGRT